MSIQEDFFCRNDWELSEKNRSPDFTLGQKRHKCVGDMLGILRDVLGRIKQLQGSNQSEVLSSESTYCISCEDGHLVELDADG